MVYRLKRGETMPVSDKTKLTHRLKRAEGQIRGVLKMIEEEKECIDIVTQLSAARSSIDRVMGSTLR